MNGVSYHLHSSLQSNGMNHHYGGSGGYVENGKHDDYNSLDGSFTDGFDSNNMDPYFDEEADQNQGLDDDADLNGYLNDLYGEEGDNAGANANDSAMAAGQNDSIGGGSKSLYELTVKKVNNQNVYEYTCKMCSKVMIGSRDILLHLKKEHGKTFDVYECHQCDFATRYRASLGRHKRSVHNSKSHQPLAKVSSSKVQQEKVDSKEDIVMLSSSPEASNRLEDSNDRRSLRSSVSQLSKDGGGGNDASRNVSMANGSKSSSQNGGGGHGNGFSSQRLAQAFSSFRRPIMTVSTIYKKYQCSACTLKSKNIFDLRKHITHKHKGQAEVQINKEYVGSYKKIVSKYTPIVRPSFSNHLQNGHQNSTSSRTETKSHVVNGNHGADSTENHKSFVSRGESSKPTPTPTQNGSNLEANKSSSDAPSVPVVAEDMKALLSQYEMRLTGLDVNYRTLNMNVVNIDTRLTTLDSRIVRIEDKLDSILKLLQKP